jgi:DDE domain
MRPAATAPSKRPIVTCSDGNGRPDRVSVGGRLAAIAAAICSRSFSLPDSISWNSSAFGTLQDRLVKEMRLAGISTVEAANAWLPGFVEDYNKRFGRAPANAKNLHRPLTEADDLDEILAWREERMVTRNLTLRYDRMMLLLDPTPLARGLAGKKAEVVNYPDGRFAVRHEGAALPFRVFDKIQTVAFGWMSSGLSGRIPSKNRRSESSPLEAIAPQMRWWHLDEMVVPIARKRMYLWRAVDHEGKILDISARYDSLIAVPAIISKVPTRAHRPAV